MDPTQLLNEIRAGLEELERTPALAGRNVIRELLVEQFIELDDWLSSGGLKPTQWELYVSVGDGSDTEGNAWATVAAQAST